MTVRILVTGANGFVGRALVARLLADGARVRAAVRRTGIPFDAPVEEVVVGTIGPSTDWRPALGGVDVVVHCAARVHQLRDGSADPLAEFRVVNRDGTSRLAQQAAEAGVRRFILLSSIGVNGAETFDVPFRASDAPRPHSPYAVSKLEAETALRRIAADTGLGAVVIRPPLVYGPDAPGNFATLLRALHRGLPMPFGAIDNRRSFVAIDNLVDLIATTARSDAAAGATFLVSDGEDLSTTELLRRIAAALGRPARLVSVPPSWLRSAANLLGRRQLGQRLCGSLQIDISPTKLALGWTPPVRVDDALVTLAQHFLASQARHGTASG